jgi:hypothetical protein
MHFVFDKNWDFISQMTAFFIDAIVKTSNLKYITKFVRYDVLKF